MPITRFVVSLVVLSAFPVIATATAQSDNPTATVPPTIADVQKVVQTINGDKIKLRAYCDIGKLQDQIRSAQEKNDTKTIDSLDAKIGSLEQQIGPEYAKIIEGLAEVDPNSAEGRKFAAVFNTLHNRCT
jgi:peptidoglycan hydrolase CwlO-like protein